MLIHLSYIFLQGLYSLFHKLTEMIACVCVVIRLYRSAENTNQRILFDIDPSGQHLGTGGQVSLSLIFIV